jgi:hypothetical protein
VSRAQRAAAIVVRCGGAEHVVTITARDIHLVDELHFFGNDGPMYRNMLGLDFIAGLPGTYPAVGVPIRRQRRTHMLRLARQLLSTLEDQRDLVTYDYQVKLEGAFRPMIGHGFSGLRVEGGVASVCLRPRGYCTLTIMGVAPTGRGRVHSIIDLRITREVATESGMLKIVRRRAPVRWFDELPKLMAFLEAQTHDHVEIVHPGSRPSTDT